MAKTVELHSPSINFTTPLSMGTWASTIYCVSIKKLKKLVRQCELKGSLHVSIFTIYRVLYLTHLQTSTFIFA